MPDKKILSEYRKTGDIELLGILYDRNLHIIYGTCLKYLGNREESKDAVMQIFEKVVVELKDREVNNFQSWIYVVSRNFCLMELRKKGKTISLDGYEEFSVPGFMDSGDWMHPLSENTVESTSDMLDKCLDELAGNQKKCITLFYYKGKCYEEICGITGFALNQVKSYLQNGRRNLKNCMDKNHVKRTEPS